MTRHATFWMAAGLLCASSMPFARAAVLEPQTLDAVRIASAHRDRGKAFLEQGKWSEASHELERAIELNPVDASAHQLLGVSYISRAQESDAAVARELLERAVTALATAVQQNSELAEAHNELGTAYDMLGRSTEAMAAYQQAAKTRPDWAAPRFNLAGVYSEAEMFDHALVLYNELIERPGELANELHRIHSAIGATYHRAEKLEEAVAAYTTSIKLNGDYYGARVGLGNVYFEQRRFEATIAEYKEAVRIQPDDAGLDFFVCRLYAILRKDDEALHWLESAMRKGFDPNIAKNSGLLRRFNKDPRFHTIFLTRP